MSRGRETLWKISKYSIKIDLYLHMRVGYVRKMKQVVIDRCEFFCMISPPTNIQSRQLQDHARSNLGLQPSRIFASTISPTKDKNIPSAPRRKRGKSNPWGLIITTHSGTTVIPFNYSKLSLLLTFFASSFPCKSSVLSVFVISACFLNCLWEKHLARFFFCHRTIKIVGPKAISPSLMITKHM